MNYYNQIAASYEELHREEQLAKLRIIKENLKLEGNEKILDIGCGQCWSTEFFDNVVGIDPAFGLLDKRKSVVNGMAEQLPFLDHSFDIILCVTAVHHFDIERAISEMKRIAKNDAVYVITVLKKVVEKERIAGAIKASFRLKMAIEEDKDVILFLSNPTS